MDIYRYFHPHHNPRLFSTPLRQQELSELEQASSELRKALERARLRTERGTPSRILPSHFDDLLKAVKFIESSLQTLCDAHEGDTLEILNELVAERSGLRGWETWARIVTEQLASECLPTTEDRSVPYSSAMKSESLIGDATTKDAQSSPLEKNTSREGSPSCNESQYLQDSQHLQDSGGYNNDHEQTRAAEIAAPTRPEGARNQMSHIITTPPAKSLTAHLQQNRMDQSRNSTRVVRPEENAPQ